MALLATLDVEDMATDKIRGAKNALDDLVQSAQRSAQVMSSSSTAASQQQVANYERVTQAAQESAKAIADAAARTKEAHDAASAGAAAGAALAAQATNAQQLTQALQQVSQALQTNVGVTQQATQATQQQAQATQASVGVAQQATQATTTQTSALQGYTTQLQQVAQAELDRARAANQAAQAAQADAQARQKAATEVIEAEKEGRKQAAEDIKTLTAQVEAKTALTEAEQAHTAALTKEIEASEALTRAIANQQAVEGKNVTYERLGGGSPTTIFLRDFAEVQKQAALVGEAMENQRKAQIAAKEAGAELAEQQKQHGHILGDLADWTDAHKAAVDREAQAELDAVNASKALKQAKEDEREAKKAVAETTREVAEAEQQAAEAAHPLATGMQMVEEAMRKAAEAARQLELIPQIVSTLAASLSEGAEVSQRQADAFKELQAVIAKNPELAAKFGDQMARLVDQFKAGTTVTADMSKELTKLATDMGAAGKATEEANKGFESMFSGAAKLAAGLSVLTAGLYVFLKAATEAAAEVELSTLALSALAENTHVSGSAAQGAVDGMQALGYSMAEATTAATSMVKAQLDLAQATKLADMARSMSIITGKNEAAQLQEIIRYIETGQSRMLKQMGIMATSEQIWRRYGDSINKATKDLTEADKKQANMNFILQEGTKFLGVWEEGLDTAAGKMRAIGSDIDDAKVRLGEGLLPTMNLVLDATQALINVWNGLSPTLRAAVASAGLFATVMTTVLAAMAVGKWLGIGTAITAVTTAFKAQAAQALFLGESVGFLTVAYRALLVTLGPVGLAILGISLAIAGAVAAYNFFKATTEKSTAELTKQVEKTVASRDATKALTHELVTLTAQAEELGGVTKLSADQQQRRADIMRELIRLSPEAIALYDKEITKTQEMIDATNRLNELRRQAAQGALDDLKKKADDSEKRVVDSARKIAELEAQMGKGIQPGERIEDILTRNAVITHELRRLRQEHQDFVEAARAALLAWMKAWEESQDPVAKAISNTSGILRDYAATLGEGAKGDAAFMARLRLTKHTIKDVYDALGSGDTAKMTRIRDDMVLFWDRYQQKLEQFREAVKQTIISLTHQMNQSSAQTVGFRIFMERELSQALKTGDMDKYLYLLRQFGPQLEGLAKGMRGAGKEAQVLQDALAKMRELRIDDAVAKAAKEMAVLQRTLEFDREQAALKAAETRENQAAAAAQQRVEFERAMGEQILAIDREIYDEQSTVQMKEIDKQVFLEKRRIEEIRRTMLVERQIRDEALKHEEEAVNRRAEYARQEIEIQRRKLALERIIAEEEIMLQIAAANRRKDYGRQQELEDDLKVLVATNQRRAALINENLDAQSAAVTEEQRINQQRLAGQREYYAKSDSARDDALRREEAASEKRIALWERDASAWFQFKRDISTGIGDAVTKGFTDMIRQGKDAVDALKGLLYSLRDTFFDIINSMVDQWIKELARMATSESGFSVTKFFAGMFGKGGVEAAAGVAGQAAGVAPAVGSAAAWAGPESAAITATGGGAAAAGGGGAAAGGLGAVGGGVIAGGGGYVVGNVLASRYSQGSYFHAGGIGAASGAATGAAIGSVVGPLGTGAGAAIGAIAGAIGGFMAARKLREQMKEDREEIIKAAGGLEEFKARAEEAGVALNTVEKFMNTKNTKQYATAVKEIDKAFTELAKVELLDAAGGLEAIKESGIVVSQAFENGTQSAEELKKELTELAKALELRDAKDNLAKTVTEMNNLSKAAVLVGYDLKNLYEADTIEDFNREQEKLNKLLEEQAKRLAGLQKMATGVAAMTEGFAMKIERAYKAAQDRPGEDAFKGTLSEFAKTDPKLMAEAQKDFEILARTISTTFGKVMRETGDITQAYAAIAEPLEKLTFLQQELGLASNEAFHKLSTLGHTIKTNQDVATSLSGIVMVLQGLSDAGGVTKEVLADMGASAAAQWKTMEERGVAADQALMVMQPTLQALWQAQKDFGLETDETTQKLIDMGLEHGIIGDKFQDVSTKMLDMLVIIAEAVGGTVPEAYKRQTQVLETETAKQERIAREAAEAAAQAQREVDEELNRDRQDSIRDGTQIVDDEMAERIRIQQEAADEEERIRAEMAEDIRQKEEAAAGERIRIEEGAMRGKAEAIERGVGVMEGAIMDGAETIKGGFGVMAGPEGAGMLESKLNDATVKQGALEGAITGGVEAIKGGFGAMAGAQGVGLVEQKLIDATAKQEILKEKVPGETEVGAYTDLGDEVNDLVKFYNDAAIAAEAFARRAVAAAQEVADKTNEISYGASPGGLKDIPIKAAEAAQGFEDMSRSAVQDLDQVAAAVNAYADSIRSGGEGNVRPSGNPFQPAREPEGEPQTVHIHMPPTNVQITSIDPSKAADVWREQIRPQMVADMENNAHQFATRIEHSTSRHRSSRR